MKSGRRRCLTIWCCKSEWLKCFEWAFVTKVRWYAVWLVKVKFRDKLCWEGLLRGEWAVFILKFNKVEQSSQLDFSYTHACFQIVGRIFDFQHSRCQTTDRRTKNKLKSKCGVGWSLTFFVIQNWRRPNHDLKN